MSVYLFYFVLIVGVVSVPPATGKKRSKLVSIFRSLEKFENLLRNISRFIEVIQTKILDNAGHVRHVIKKLRDVGPRIQNGLQRLLDYIKPFEKFKSLDEFIQPVDDLLTLVMTVVKKINNILSGDMTSNAKNKLHIAVKTLCCKGRCPCKPLEKSKPALSFVERMKELAEKLIKRKH